MKKIGVLFLTFSIAVLLTGCITVSQYRFSFNFDTGKITREYCDLRSKKGVDEKDYSVENDWAELKRLVAEQKPEFDPDVVEDISKELFEEKDVLSARKVQKVSCPKCFPSKAAIMTYVHANGWRFEMSNDEVVLFLPPGNKIVSTNGQKVTTAKNSMIFWPKESGTFEYVVTEQHSGGTSLLPNYLKERKLKN